jgi:alanyl-tRNA synthetase
MLGNFSFGDYFKSDAIEFAWDFLTNVLDLDKSRLWVTVHESDLESIDLWKKIASINEERIQVMGDDNFWKMGDTGPRGPCSEIYFDRGISFGSDGGPKHGGDERFVEIWNLVFMQFQKDSDGRESDLPYPCIDTGAGLERILPILNQTDSVYDTDLFSPLISLTDRLCKHSYKTENEAIDKKFRIVADHSRAAAMLIADGVFPSNEGRGHVLRRIIRRFIKNLWQLGYDDSASDQYIDTVVASLNGFYPNLEQNVAFVKSVFGNEEASFKKTLQKGLLQIDDVIKSLKGSQETTETVLISGDVAFKLYDTFGFPVELTTEIARENDVKVDLEEFNQLMSEQKLKAQTDAKLSAHFENITEDESYRQIADRYGRTNFVGYETLSTQSEIIGVMDLAAFGSTEKKVVKPSNKAVINNPTHIVILDKTPFYAEGGGQVGDMGTIYFENNVFKVVDTQSTLNSITKHIGYFESGSFAIGDTVKAEINRTRRESIMRNHTATHLLHHCLRLVLGDHVRQQGSLVADDRLRFDFSHFSPLSETELLEIQDLCNRQIISNQRVVTEVMEKTEAENIGAIAFFGDKYGDTVRVVKAGSDSIEFCGGTHVNSLGAIGHLIIVSESSIGSNTRRIEAITGEASIKYINAQSATLKQIAQTLRTEISDTFNVVDKLVQKEKLMELRIKDYEKEYLSKTAKELISKQVNGIIVESLKNLNMDQLKELAYIVKGYKSIRAAFIVSVIDESKISLIMVSNDDSFNANSLVKELSVIVKGGGGGNASIATAGGKDISEVNNLLESAKRRLTA